MFFDRGPERLVDLGQRFNRSQRVGYKAVRVPRVVVEDLVERQSDALGKFAAVLQFLSLGVQLVDLTGRKAQRLQLLELEGQQVEPRGAVGLGTGQFLEALRERAPLDVARRNLRTLVQQPAEVIKQVALDGAFAE